MIDIKNTRNYIAKGLKEHLGIKVIRGNQTNKAPKFPYLVYNITTLASQNNGTYGEDEASAGKQATATFSITVHSDDYDEAVRLANEAKTWLDYSGTEYLNNNGVIVETVGNVTDRSVLLTVGYNYSFGFDCFVTVMDIVSLDQINNGTIETVEIKEEI